MQRWLSPILVFGWLFCCSSVCFGMIRGDKGNAPIDDPGWPKGATDLFNSPNRVAWWEGPPFGGGQWHAECQGDADDFNAALEAFQKMEVETKRLVVHDGVGVSFWLDPNRQHAGDTAAQIQWLFVVWQPDRWEMQKQMPSDISAVKRGKNENSPVPEMHLYAGGAIDWDDVKVPQGIEVVDNRLVAHGFAMADGRVLEGNVVDSKTGDPLSASIYLESIDANPKGGYVYKRSLSTTTDGQGHWLFKNVDTQWYRVIGESDGYLPRVLTHIRYTDEPGWEALDTKLAKACKVTGRVIDTAGKPLAQATVSLHNVALPDQGSYQTIESTSNKTDEHGHFELDTIVDSNCLISAHRDGYVRKGLGIPLTTPSDPIDIELGLSSSIVVQVVFPNSRKDGGYLVHIEEEGGEKVGTYGGSGDIDTDNKITFSNMPPGKYVLYGRPNPGSDTEQTADLNVELEPGKQLVVEIKAR